MRRLADGHTANVKFSEFLALLRCFGFDPDGSRGSHQFFKHHSRPIRINLQPLHREAKDYQVRQFLALVEEFELEWLCDD